MSYTKHGANKKSKEIIAPGPKLGRSLKVILYKVILIAAFALVVSGIFLAYGIYKGIIDSSPTIAAMDVTPTGYQTQIVDSKGNVTATLVASGSNRVYVTIDEIPLNLQHAFVAIEDERFYEHNGIDVKGIIRAGFTGLTSGKFSQGASTITQQLLKNSVFTTWTTDKGFAKVVRKLQEQYLAVELEKKVNNKDWILENYMNTVNLGQNCLGVQAAAKRYFDKDVSELTLSECAVIAGITQNPSGLNPITHPEENAARREKVLGNMLEQGYITQKKYDKAMADDVYSRIQKVDVKKAEILKSVNSYFDDEVTDQVVNDLQEILGYSRAEAYKAVYSGGLTIVSTQDPDIQAVCDREVNNLENYPTEPKYSFNYALTIKSGDEYYNYDEQTMLSYYQHSNASFSINYTSKEAAGEAIEAYKAEIMHEGDEIIAESVNYNLEPQVALTVMDQSTGEVKAIVGGRGDKTANRTYNRATDAARQPGSCFKVLAAYAPAIDAAGMTLASVEDDAPYSYLNGTSLSNYDDRYRGLTSFRKAIASSINVVTVKCLTDIGIENGYSYLEDFGFTTLAESDKVQALALGGITNGVTNLELTAAYAAIANQGNYIKPRFYSRIIDHDGNVLIDNEPQSRSVLKETSAWLLTDAMKDVIKSGTSTICQFDGMAMAGKSGTTTKNRDALFAGYTPYYTCVVWGGFDDNSVQTGGTSYPKVIWREVMKSIHEGLEYKDFEKPDGIVECEVCSKSGLLPIEGVCDCDPRGSMIVKEYFSEDNAPTQFCDRHVSVETCTKSGKLANQYCPEGSVKKQVYLRGVDPGSADSEYRLPDDTATSVCDIHYKKDVSDNNNTGGSSDEGTTIIGDTSADRGTEIIGDTGIIRDSHENTDQTDSVTISDDEISNGDASQNHQSNEGDTGQNNSDDEGISGDDMIFDE